MKASKLFIPFIVMVITLFSSVTTTSTRAIGVANYSTDRVTKMAKEAVSGSLQTESSSSVLQKKLPAETSDSISEEAGTKESEPSENSDIKDSKSLATSEKVKVKTQSVGPESGKNPRVSTLGTVEWYVDLDTETLHLSGGTLPDIATGIINGTSPWNYPGYAYTDRIKTIEIDGDIQAKDISNLFSKLPQLKKVSNIDRIKGATSTNSLFSSDSALESVDITNFDFSNVREIGAMFSNCKILESVGDTTNLNFTKLQSMSNVFFFCSALKNVNVSKWNVSNVTNMDHTFWNCKSLAELDVSHWDTSKVTSLDSTFSGCSALKVLDVSNWDTSNVKNMTSTFSGVNVPVLDVSNWDTSKVTSLDSTFRYVGNLEKLDVSRWNTSNVTTLKSTFEGIRNIKSLDVSHWNTSNVTNMNSTFFANNINNVSNITELDVKNWDTSKVTTMYQMFRELPVTKLDIGNWDTSNVTDMGLMFNSTKQLKTAEYPNWNTSNVKNMDYMFSGAHNLTDVDFTNWDTSKVTRMENMVKANQLSHMKLGHKFKFVFSTPTTGPNLPEPSTVAPYYGKWQRHDNENNQIGPTYTSVELMNQYDGVKLPVGDYYWARIDPPTITKLVRNNTIDGKQAPFKKEITAKKGDVIQYQITLTQPKGQRLEKAIFEDILDSHLRLTGSGLTIKYMDANGNWGGEQLVSFDSNNQIAAGKTLEEGMQVQLNITAQVTDDDVGQIDNLLKLVSGSYGVGTESNIATIHITKPLSVTKSVKNETKKTDWNNKQDVSPNDQVGFKVDFQNTTGTTSNQVTFKDTLKNNELTYKTNSLSVTYQDGTKEVISTTAEQNFAATGVLILNRPLKNYESVTINFSAIVSPLVSYGSILHNSANISADNINSDVTSNIVDMTVLKSEHQLRIRYVDLDGDLSHPETAPTQIAPETVEKGLTGTKLSSILPGQKVAPKLIDGYTIYSVTEDNDLVGASWTAAYADDPEFGENDRVITYGYKKSMLTIDAPTNWEFGKYNTKQVNRTYYLNAKGVPQGVTVIDNYGVQNWQLQLSQADSFKDDESRELENAKWQFSNGNIQTLVNDSAGIVTMNTSKFTLSPGENVTLMTMQKSGKFQTDNPDTSNSQSPYTKVGKGSWEYRFGDNRSANYSIGLNVPATTRRYEGRYRTQLNWSLIVAP